MAQKPTAPRKRLQFGLAENPHSKKRYPQFPHGVGALQKTGANAPIAIPAAGGVQADPVPGAVHGGFSGGILETLLPGAIGAAGAVTPLGIAGALLPTLLPMGLNMLMGESEQDKNYAALRQQQQEHMENVLAPASKGQGPMFRALGEQIADRSKGQMQQTMQRAPTGTSIAREQFRRQKAQEGAEFSQAMPQLLASAQGQYQQAMQQNIMQAQQDRAAEQQSRQGFMNALTGGLFTDTSTGESEGTDELSQLVMKMLPSLIGLA